MIMDRLQFFLSPKSSVETMKGRIHSLGDFGGLLHHAVDHHVIQNDDFDLPSM